MKPVVVDTDVVSYLFKSDPRSNRFLPFLEGRSALISFMTEAELEQWILQHRWGREKIERFRQFMARFTSVPSSRDLVVKWAEVMVGARRVGRRIEAADAWVAATALLYEAELATNNRGDYVGVAGLEFAGR